MKSKDFSRLTVDTLLNIFLIHFYILRHFRESFRCDVIVYKAFAGVLILVSLFSSVCSAQRYHRDDLPELINLINELPQSDTAKISLLQEAAYLYIMKAGELPKDLDSALLMIEQAEVLSEKSKLYPLILKSRLLKGVVLMERSDFAAGKVALLSVAEDYRKLEDKENHAYAISMYALYTPHRSKDRKIYLRQAELAYLAAGNEKKVLECRLHLVGHQYAKGLLDSALFNVQLLLKDWEGVEGPEIVNVYSLRAAIHMQYGNYNAVIENLLLVLNMLDDGEHTNADFQKRYRYFMSIDIGRAHYHLRNYKKAFEWYERALEEGKTNYQNYIYVDCVTYLAKLMIQQGRPKEALNFVQSLKQSHPPLGPAEEQASIFALANCYNALHQDDLAEKNYKLAISMGHLVSLTGEYLNTEAEFYLSRGNFNEAKSTSIKVISNSDSTAMPLVAKSTALYTLYMADSALGNYMQAMNYLKQHMETKEFIFEQSKSRQIEELSIRYETAKKDQELKQLSQRSERQAQQQKAIVAAIVFLIFILALIYILYRNKQKTNRKLIHLLDEKEWLLREVHHRVKNNLQTVLSLLESQSRQLSSEALHAIQDSQNRVYAMSLIHKRLYQSTDVASVDMEEYLRELIQHLNESLMGSKTVPISLDLDRVELDVSQAVSLGLIVNEAITNSMKYAFPGETEGSMISVSLKKLENQKAELKISDNGVGIPELKKKNAGSLGLKLMRGLTEDIDGIFSITSEAGVQVFVRFVANLPLQMLSEKRY
ncbi:tetratricopeptide repeat-containing sensor histidine kinase [Algoriphagus terrigena]|uniref:tetratricopeptide repeat-containing sensor histidine kinase n=1 Tax=Algoriphagus terrigena TaxID=344884 RepID=UPI00042559C8|nr:histidine kinase dimerization/phosphoacceptor domain -containing protein [Algoriphagus terrigena]